MYVDPLGGKVLLTHLMKHHQYKAETRKKRPASRSFFSYRPVAGAVRRSVIAQQAMVRRVYYTTLYCSTLLALSHYLQTVIEQRNV